MGLSIEKTARALALAATFSSGLKANFGTMTKPLHVGQAARNGLYAALLASEDFTASADAIEHRQGFLRVFNGEGNFTTDPIVAEWGAPWDIVDPGLAIKQYPSCGSTHPAVDAMLMLVRENDLRPAMVTKIKSQTHPRRFAHTNRPDPRGALDAKFSVQVLPRARVGQPRGVDLNNILKQTAAMTNRRCEPFCGASRPRRGRSGRWICRSILAPMSR